MLTKSPEHLKEEVLYHLHQHHFPKTKSIHTQWLSKIKQPGISVHFHLEGDDVTPVHNVEFHRKKNPKKETLKMMVVEFIFLPISFIFSAGIHAAVYLLHYHHVFLFGFIIPHFISTLISWFSAAVAKLGIRQTISPASTKTLLNLLKNGI